MTDKTMKKRKSYGVSKFDCSQIEKELISNNQFKARLIRKDSVIDLQVELIHCADWSQFLFLEDNPRVFLCMLPPKDSATIELQPSEIAKLELYIHHKDKECHCLFKRYISPLEFTKTAFQYRADDEEDCYVVEKSFGSYKNFAFQYLKRAVSSPADVNQQMTSREDEEIDMVNDPSARWFLQSIKYHFSLWELWQHSEPSTVAATTTVDDST